MWFILRHGETLHNRKKIKQGCYNSMLTLKGIDQMKSIAYRMMKKENNFDNYSLISSPMVRTLHSMQIIQEIIGLTDVIVQHDVLLSEVDAGDFTNVSKELILQRDPDFFERKKLNFWNFSCPNGETYNQAYKRFSDFFEEYKNDKNLIITTHGCGVKFLASIVQGIKKDDYVFGEISIDQNYFYCWDNNKISIF